MCIFCVHRSRRNLHCQTNSAGCGVTISLGKSLVDRYKHKTCWRVGGILNVHANNVTATVSCKCLYCMFLKAYCKWSHGESTKVTYKLSTYTHRNGIIYYIYYFRLVWLITWTLGQEDSPFSQGFCCAAPCMEVYRILKSEMKLLPCNLH